MPGEYTRRTLKFPEHPHTPSIVVQILTKKDNARANEVADEISTWLANAVPALVLGKMTQQIKIEKGELWTPPE